MNCKITNFNYLLQESDDESIKIITSRVAKYFVQLNKPILIITKNNYSASEAKLHFSGLNYDQRQLISFMVCAKAEILLEKLLEIDVTTKASDADIPKVIIVESLHTWSDAIPLEKIPKAYSTLIAATQDAVNVLSQMSGESCYSFVSSNLDEFPKSIVDHFYTKTLKNVSDVDEIIKFHS